MKTCKRKTKVLTTAQHVDKVIYLGLKKTYIESVEYYPQSPKCHVFHNKLRFVAKKYWVPINIKSVKWVEQANSGLEIAGICNGHFFYTCKTEKELAQIKLQIQNEILQETAQKEQDSTSE